LEGQEPVNEQQLRKYQRDPVCFIDDLITKNELNQPFSLKPHQREILRLAFAFDEDGRLPYDTILWSTIKKSGKTTINGTVKTWWGFTQEPPNELLGIANDLEQSLGRVFKTVAGLIRCNQALTSSAEIQARQILLSNGTVLTALASEYAGAAGSNHGFTSWDELWGYTSESSFRLWEELTPVPTRKNSIRFITTYAGWENESTLLWEIYKLGVGKEEHLDGQGERIHPDLPVYVNKSARLFVYWDHEPRMEWQTPAYYAAQKKSGMRAGTYQRIHENRWATAESIFITGELWDPCIDHELSPLLPTKKHPIFVGVDGSVKGDTAAVVAVRRDLDKLILVSHRIWRPTRENPLDLESTIETHLAMLHEKYFVQEILCDPYQLHRSITTLKSQGLSIREFPQTVPNTTLMGQSIFEALKGKNLKLYPSDELREQALNTVAVENPRGWRIAKEKASKKIDSIVALAMACVAALDSPAVRRWIPL
jgi:phage terminase large subunit-like protein